MVLVEYWIGDVLDEGLVACVACFDGLMSACFMKLWLMVHESEIEYWLLDLRITITKLSTCTHAAGLRPAQSDTHALKACKTILMASRSRVSLLQLNPRAL